MPRRCSREKMIVHNLFTLSSFFVYFLLIIYTNFVRNNLQRGKIKSNDAMLMDEEIISTS